MRKLEINIDIEDGAPIGYAVVDILSNLVLNIPRFAQMQNFEVTPPRNIYGLKIKCSWNNKKSKTLANLQPLFPNQ
jgi:hypothetical protein